MTAIIHRQTKYTDNNEVTTIRVFGVTVFKRVIIDTDEHPRRQCGFNVFPSDAPGHFVGDFDDDSDTNDKRRKIGRFSRR